MRERLSTGTSRLERSLERTLHAASASLHAIDARLYTLSPLAVLERGYALVLGANGQVIRKTAQVSTGDVVTTRLIDGEFSSRVETVTRRKGTRSKRHE
jgi:exodeoxyribonuclease VII large subunit